MGREAGPEALLAWQAGWDGCNAAEAVAGAMRQTEYRPAELDDDDAAVLAARLW